MTEQAVLCYFNTLKEEGCYDFLRPSIQDDVQDILQNYEQGSWPVDPAEVLAPSAVRSMEEMLLERLQILYAGILISKLNRMVKRYDITQAIRPPAQATAELRLAAKDLKRELDRPDPDGLHREYVLLGGYAARIRRNYKTHMREVITRSFTCRQEIADSFFRGDPPGKILGFEASGADLHRKGRCVIHVIAQAGDFYYKPHDCGLDLFYRQLTDAFFKDATMAPAVVQKSGYGFVSALARKGLDADRAEGPETYYYHFGILAAVLHGIGSNDMHGENMIPCGERPCIVDMESVVSTLKKSESRDMDPERHFRESETSVFRVGFLPARLHKAGLVSPLYRCEAAKDALPFSGESTYTVEGFETEFLQGFRDGYRRMMARREEILRMLPDCAGVLVRIIPFNTMYYARCRARLFSEEALKSPKLTGKYLEDLSIPFTWYGREVNTKQTEYEAAALREGDIPYFCAAFCSHDLCGNDTREPVQREYLSLSAEEYTTLSLNRLSEEDLLFEEDLLKRSFAHAPLDVEAGREETEWPAGGGPEAGEIQNGMAVQAAMQTGTDIFREMISDRFYTVDGLPIWLSPASTVRKRAGLPAQLAGAVLAADQLLSCRVPAGLREEAEQFLRESAEALGKTLERILKMDPRQIMSRISLGFGEGLGQILAGLGAAGAAGRDRPDGTDGKTGTQTVREMSRQFRIDLIQHLADIKIWEAERPDVLEGISGLLLGLLAGAEREDNIPESCGPVLVKKCADRLLEGFPEEEPDAFTGTAGIGAALAAAYRFTGDRRYAEGALQAFSKVKAQYSTAVNGWTESAGALRWIQKRAPKAAGIGLCALKALEEFERSEQPAGQGDVIRDRETGSDGADTVLSVMKDVLDLALKSLSGETVLFWNDALLRGNALSVLFLTRAGEYLHEDGLIMKAGRILMSMHARSEKYGYYHVMEKGVRNSFDVSFPEGSAGIGYAAFCCLAALQERVTDKGKDI